MPSPDSVIAGCAMLTSACAFVDAARSRLVASLDRIVERDVRATPAPRRAVLVLNDEPGALLTMAHLLEPLGVPILTASTVAEARTALDRDRPCAIVADYYLGGGETCAALLRDRLPRTRAVIVTGAVDTARIATIAQGVGADLRDIPLDDADVDALVALVRSYLPPEAA